jgi:hypothetical protein
VDGGNYITSICEKDEKILFIDDNNSDIWSEISYIEIQTTDR